MKFNTSGDIHFVTFRTYQKKPYFEDEKLTISKVMQNIKSHSARDIIDYYKKVGSQEPLLLARLGD